AYTDIESKLTAADIAKLPRRRMDCIDCHNRVSHSFRSPDQVLDNLLSTKQIDPAMPEIKQRGAQLLAEKYPNRDAAQQAIAGLESFYKQNYADYAAKNSPAIQRAIGKLQEWSAQIRYPEQGLDWTIHADDIGHKDFPGCFRCHDGKHFTPDRKQAIRLECNICHTIPQVIAPGGPAPIIAITRGEEPSSHKTTTWLAQHRTAFTTACQQCHDTNNAGGKDNSSFCSNSACHGTAWKFAGLNAPALAPIVNAPIRPPTALGAQPKAVPHPVGGNPDCQICHGAQSKVRPAPADHTGRANATCLTCHKASVPAAAPTSTTAPTTSAAPTPVAQPTAPRATKGEKLPADHAGRTVCVMCHSTGISKKMPADHAGRTDEMCRACHQ
ncbi:MAG: hypothetical protein L0Y55_20135, partial [Anaerolineales bacterium]|nr:hypothetical protein [Anaerolineales bacterium]